MEIRTGHGYDVHRLTQGRKLILGGVDIPHHLGLLGHSDADVVTHALMDALLGAAGMDDIGRLFPDCDNAFLNISSLTLLERVMKALQEFLRPEFINRVDEIVYFHQLTEENFRGIAGIMLEELKAALEEKGYTFVSAEIEMVPQNYITLSSEGDVKNMEKLIDMLEDNDDVQEVYHNWESDEE